jgi:hypothetical protein
MNDHARIIRMRLTAVYLASCMLVGSVALASSATWAAEGITVLEPGTAHYGKSYAQLTGDWYNWAIQFPLATNPIVENGLVDCSRGQAGKIWFLAGNFAGAAGEPNPSSRTCTLPSGKALFFPLANSIFWVPEDAATVDEVRNLANAPMNVVSQLRLTIDGVAVSDPFAYRAQSPPGGFALRFGRLLADFGYPPLPDPRQAVTDGYWILLAPLPYGSHEIQFSSTSPTFKLQVTYHLTVGR